MSYGTWGTLALQSIATHSDHCKCNTSPTKNSPQIGHLLADLFEAFFLLSLLLIVGIFIETRWQYNMNNTMCS